MGLATSSSFDNRNRDRDGLTIYDLEYGVVISSVTKYNEGNPTPGKHSNKTVPMVCDKRKYTLNYH